MILICALSVAINAGGIAFLIKADTQGKVISESATKYLVDFSDGVKTYKLVGTPADYSKVLINKSDCVKL